jgi:hypothetical protein
MHQRRSKQVISLFLIAYKCLNAFRDYCSIAAYSPAQIAHLIEGFVIEHNLCPVLHFTPKNPVAFISIKAAGYFSPVLLYL